MAKEFKKSRKTKYFTPQKVVLGILGLLLLIGILEATNTTHVLHKPKTISTIPVTNPTTTDSTPSKSSNGTSTTTTTTTPSSNTTAPAKTPTNAPSADNGKLLEPTGNFVSNHHPGSATSTAEQSVCNTSSGATCYIEFSKGSDVKVLPTKTADSNGAAFWDWDVKDAGLSSGSWQIKAVVSLGGQTKTAIDNLSLDVAL